MDDRYERVCESSDSDLSHKYYQTINSLEENKFGWYQKGKREKPIKGYLRMIFVICMMIILTAIVYSLNYNPENQLE